VESIFPNDHDDRHRDEEGEHRGSKDCRVRVGPFTLLTSSRPARRFAPPSCGSHRWSHDVTLRCACRSGT